MTTQLQALAEEFRPSMPPDVMVAWGKDAQAELRRLHAENEALRADAERYRWLRDQTTDDGIAIVMKNKHINDSISYPNNINGYIDAAKERT